MSKAKPPSEPLESKVIYSSYIYVSKYVLTLLTVAVTHGGATHVMMSIMDEGESPVTLLCLFQDGSDVADLCFHFFPPLVESHFPHLGHIRFFQICERRRVSFPFPSAPAIQQRHHQSLLHPFLHCADNRSNNTVDIRFWSRWPSHKEKKTQNLFIFTLISLKKL